MLAAPSSGSVCSSDGCAYSGSTGSGSPIAGYYGTMSDLHPYYVVTWINTGKTCSQAGLSSGLGGALVDTPGSDSLTCPPGQVLTVNGTTGSCGTPADPSKAVGTPTPSNAPPSPTTPGQSPSSPAYFDKSGLATESGQSLTNAKLDQLHTDLTTDGIKLKETGTPTDASLSQANSNFESASQSKLDQINAIAGSGKVSALDWVWSPSLPTGACDSFDFSGRWGSGLFISPCSNGHIDDLRAILAWVYSLFAVVYIWQRVSDAPGGK